MAQQQGNGRKVASDDRWRPGDDNGLRRRRGASDDDEPSYRDHDRDDERFAMRDRERSAAHWDDRSSRWDDREGYARSTERYGQGQSGYAAGRYDQDRSFGSRYQAYSSSAREHDRGTDDRFTGRGGEDWSPQDYGGRMGQHDRYGSSYGYGYGMDRPISGQYEERYSERGMHERPSYGRGGYVGGGMPGGYGHGVHVGYEGRQGMYGGTMYSGGYGAHGHERAGMYGQDVGSGGYLGQGGQQLGYGAGGPYGGGGYEEPMQGRGTMQSRYGAQGYQGYQGYGVGALRGGWNQQMIGPHRGKGPAGFQRSDERIKEIVCEVLTDEGEVDASNIEVSVKNGEVTLSGTVEDRHQKRVAEDCVERLPFVKDVQNLLRISGERKSASAVDRSGRESIGREEDKRR